MEKRSRTLWAILLGVPVLLVLPVAILGAGTLGAGSIDVDIVEKGCGSTLGVHVPAALVPVAVRLMPTITVDGRPFGLDQEARDCFRIARVVAEELDRIPDGVLVDVMDREDVVSIRKDDGRLEIFVDTPGESVRISVPIVSVREAARALEAI